MNAMTSSMRTLCFRIHAFAYTLRKKQAPKINILLVFASAIVLTPKHLDRTPWVSTFASPYRF